MNDLENSEQFTLLLTSHQRRLVGYLRTLVPNRADAEEVLQEVNLYLCAHANEFRQGTDFAAWALRVAHFCVLTWRGRCQRDRLQFDDSLIEQLAASATRLDNQENKRRDALASCLRKLKPGEYTMITSLYGEPSTNAQSVATSVGKSVKGIYVLLKRIRLKLMECIERTIAAEEHPS